jgi:SulP family sulfate permease
MDTHQIRIEVLSGITIAIALIPEAISFALLVGAAPHIGLWAAFFMAMSTAIFGGRPGLISGATGATAVIMAGLVSTAGIDALYLGVLVAGLIQLLIWITNAWKIFTKIPSSAISGFLIALAIMILLSQFAYLKVGLPNSLELFSLIFVIIVSAGVMLWSARRISIPPALTAIVIGIILGLPLGLATVGDLSHVSAELPSFTIPKFSLDLLIIVLPFSFGMAISGLVESILTVESISNRLGELGDKKKETFAQGIGNIISSLFGSMGGCVLVGQTNLNILAGAKKRLSGIVAATCLGIIILALGKYIEMIPLAGLIGVMIVVVYETGDWKSLNTRNFLSILVISMTVVTSLITHNLAIGVIVGTLIHYIFKRNESII